MEVHLDLVGGLAGDMFIAGLLDAFPHLTTRVVEAVQLVSGPSPVTCALLAHQDHVLQGHRFLVESVPRPATAVPFAALHVSHEHTTWPAIRARLGESPLPVAVRDHALGIFRLLAEAEAFVHGVGVETVTFHEVGAWDSIADIVGAATLIDAIGATRWTTSAAPLGSGRVHTAHGPLPVPAPATARLLTGMATIDDGIAGERVTPTGAALLRYLCPPSDVTERAGVVRTLIASGTGFGARRLPGLSNHVRVLCFDLDHHGIGGHRQLQMLEFEIDDQSGEDLAAGLERLRSHAGVLEVTQSAACGKKGRLTTHVQLLANPAHLAGIVDACFRETTTIGLRHHAVHGIALKRKIAEVRIDGHRFRVKVVERPGGRTAKTESDDVSRHEEYSRRAALRVRAEAAALREDPRTDAAARSEAALGGASSSDAHELHDAQAALDA